MSRSSTSGARQVALARVLHARLYVNLEGRIFAVRGRVAHDKLKKALARIDRCPTAANAPTPRDLGVPACDGELSQHLLHCISRALNRWRKDVSMEMRRKPAKRRTAMTLARDQEEIGRLTSRLAAVRHWHAELASGAEPAGSPFFLDSGAEKSLEAALENAQREHPLTPLIAWQARLVHWLSGDYATRRFLSATTRLLGTYPSDSFRVQVHSFQQALIVWQGVCRARLSAEQH